MLSPWNPVLDTSLIAKGARQFRLVFAIKTDDGNETRLPRPDKH